MNRQEFEKYIEQGGKLFVVLEPDNLFLSGDVVEFRRYDGIDVASFYYPNHEPRDRAHLSIFETWHYLMLSNVKPFVPFKVGDLVRCTNNGRYTYTTPKVVCRVTAVYTPPLFGEKDIRVEITEGMMKGDCYDVESTDFKLVHQCPFKVGDVVIAFIEKYYITSASVKCRVVSLTPPLYAPEADMEVKLLEDHHPFSGALFSVSSAYFKLAAEEENPPTLEVTQDGNTITVKLTENGKVTEASAKCSPTDTFDYLTGVQIALTRLAQKTGKPPKIYLPKDTTAYQVELL